MTIPVVLYGASGHALTIAEVLETWRPQPLARVIAYIDDGRGDAGEQIAGAPIISFAAWQAAYRAEAIFIAVGGTANRRNLVERVIAEGGYFPTFPFISGIRSDGRVGADSLLHPYAPVGPGTTFGNHVQLMPLASIDAECSIGDYTTVCPMAVLYGRIVVEPGVFIGVGAKIVNETDDILTIGAGATIAAGAVVLHSVAPGQTVAGNPATDLRTLAKRRRETNPIC